MNIFEEIKKRLTMQEVAEHYGHTPDRKGFIRCPFHDEKTPSCKLDDEKGMFYCFGCGTYGDAVRFVLLLKGYSKPLEAAKELAAWAGIPVAANGWKPPVRPPATPATVSLHQMRQHLQQWQATTFRELLAAKSEMDEVFRSYSQGHEDAPFHAALAIRTEIETVLDELAAPDEYTLIELFERKGRDIDEFIRKRRNSVRTSREPQKSDGCGAERENGEEAPDRLGRGHA